LQFCQPFIMYLLIRFRYGVSDYAAAALANGLLKDFGLITNSDRVEVIDPSKISREKRRIGIASIAEREEDTHRLHCIGLDSKRDANVPVILQSEEGEAVRIFKTKATVDHLTFTAESGEEI